MSMSDREAGMNRKQKRDAKNARHRRNEHRRHLRRIVRRSLIYAWTWPEAEQNAEAQKWIDWK